MTHHLERDTDYTLELSNVSDKTILFSDHPSTNSIAPN
jgi:hypothetical protein